MTIYKTLSISLIASAALAGCYSLPPNNAQLDQARSDYRVAQDNPSSRDLAGREMKQAEDALNKAQSAWEAGERPEQVNHMAYLAKQRVAIAREAGDQRAAEQMVADAGNTRDKMRLDARTNELDAAQRQATAAGMQTANVQARNRSLEAQLRDMNAQQTSRGMVITIGDVLFDTNQSRLKSGGLNNIDKVASFLKDFPMRKALIEGYTDSVGSAASNDELSTRRADTVRNALVQMGVGGDRIAARGYGEEYPAAGNDSSSGRQLNRRVEIILSDDNGAVSTR